MAHTNDHTPDPHLDAWLDAYAVDTSAARLARLEACIMDEIPPPGWLPPISFLEGLGAFSAAGAIALSLFFVLETQDPLPAYNGYYAISSFELWSTE